jgi:four helix bundle protein
MTSVRNFTDLKCWQRARQWSKQIFWRTRKGSFPDDRRLVNQVNDSSESAMSNMAEGFGRGTQGEFITFLGYSIGSINETQSHLCAAYDRQHLQKDEFGELFQEGTEIRKLTVALIRSMVKPGSGVKHIRKASNFTEDVWEIYERVTGQQRPELFRRKTDDDE